MIGILSSGLFHGAIAESGSMLTDWALDRDSKKTGVKITEYAGCGVFEQVPYEELLHCLRTVDVKTLKDAQRKYSVRFFSHFLLLTTIKYHFFIYQNEE